MKKITIFTDGGCHGNPGPGGWAAILRHGEKTKEVSGGEEATTNNRMEIRAAIAGLSELRVSCEVTVYTDSQYLRQGITEWIGGWKARGWVTAKREPVKNSDLWRELDIHTQRHQVTWEWLKGHTGHPENERCDFLAAAEIEKIRASRTSDHLAASLEAFQNRERSHQGQLL